MTKEKKERIGIIDAARGLAIILMVVYHFAFDLYNAELLPGRLMYAAPVNILREFFAALFVFISGTVALFSRSNLKRGIFLLVLGQLISLVTYLYDPREAVRFGVLTLLGASSVVFHFTKKGLGRLPAWSVFAFCAAVAAVTWSFRFQTFDVEHLWMFGFPNYYFTSADYFPLLPYLFVFLAGTAFGRYVRGGKLPGWFYTVRCRFFEAAGRRSLIIYLAHQPVLIGIVALIEMIVGKS